jgi:hypothetical protein
MVTSARFRFAGTLVVSVLAVILTLLVTGDSDGGDSPTRIASQLPPPQR